MLPAIGWMRSSPTSVRLQAMRTSPIPGRGLRRAGRRRHLRRSDRAFWSSRRRRPGWADRAVPGDAQQAIRHRRDGRCSAGPSASPVATTWSVRCCGPRRRWPVARSGRRPGHRPVSPASRVAWPAGPRSLPASSLDRTVLADRRAPARAPRRWLAAVDRLARDPDGRPWNRAPSATSDPLRRAAGVLSPAGGLGLRRPSLRGVGGLRPGGRAWRASPWPWPASWLSIAVDRSAERLHLDASDVRRRLGRDRRGVAGRRHRRAGRPADNRRRRVRHRPSGHPRGANPSGVRAGRRRLVEPEALEPVLGAIAPTLTAGRLPTGPSEVAIGATVADDLGADIGDTSRSTGTAARFRARRRRPDPQRRHQRPRQRLPPSSGAGSTS